MEAATRELSFEEKLDKIQQYLPERLSEKILSQRGRIEGERKIVTVMFCDLVGYTGISEQIGPEEAYSLMDGIYEILIQKVHDYEGTVNEMTGDGIMALFGAPIALEDAPQRAIRSAYSIHREMAAFSDRIKKQQEAPQSLKMRIGIHTGPVVVGTLGNDLRMDFKAVGDTVNLASRIEGIAEPGATYVTETTFKLAKGLFRFEALGAKAVKGKEAAVHAYRVIAPSGRRTRFDVAAERGLTQFIGRERLIEMLLDGFKRCKEGRGQAFSITADAGVGKSRLLYEFRKAVSNENLTFLEGKCLSYSGGVAYHLIIDILKANFNIQEKDGDSQITAKVKSGLNLLGLTEASVLPYFLELLSVKDSGIAKISVSAEGKKDRIIEAIKAITLKGAEVRPLIMTFEDLQWIDKSSEEFLNSLLPSISGSRIFLIFTYRPEYKPTWKGISYYSQAAINRFSNRESLALAADLLSTNEIDDDLQDLILEKTDGVPLFIEEFIKSLKDLKMIERRSGTYYLAQENLKLSIPDTIQDVIMARVDSLPEDAKKVLQIASVIEREFSYELVKRVIRPLVENELLSHLSSLMNSELVYARGEYPPSSYIFKNALTREAVYDSILTRNKRNIHEEVGQSMEALYEDSLHEHYGALAKHFFIAGSYQKASEYSLMAYNRALKTASVSVAIEHSKRRLMSLENLPADGTVQAQRIDARTQLAVNLFMMFNYSEAKKVIDPILKLAESEEFKSKLSQIYTIIGSYDFMVKEDTESALQTLHKALRIAEETQDAFSLFFANYLLSLACSWNCDFEKTSFHMQKALNVNLIMDVPWATSIVKSNESYYGYNCMGKVNQGYATSREALRLAENSEDVLAIAVANVCHGISCFHKGFFEEAMRFLTKGIKFCERINTQAFGALAHHWLGFVCTQKKEYEQAIQHFRDSIALRVSIGWCPSTVNFTKMAAAYANLLSGENKIDLAKLKDHVRDNKVKFYEGGMARYLGLNIVISTGKFQGQGEDWLKKALTLHRRNVMRWDLACDYFVHGDTLQSQGDFAQAIKSFKSAKELFIGCGSNGWVRETDQALAPISGE